MATPSTQQQQQQQQQSSIMITCTTESQPAEEDEDEIPLNQYHTKNIRRFTAICGVCFFLMCDSTHIYWGIWAPILDRVPEVLSVGATYHLIYSWFIGAILGGLIAAFSVKKVQKGTFYYTSGTIILITAILFIAFYYEYAVILVCRYFAGLAHGVAFVIAVIHAGEIAAKRLRGYELSLINLLTTTGLVVVTFLYRMVLDKDSNLHVNQVFGSGLIILSLVGFGLTKYFLKESPIYLLQNGRNNEVLPLLKELRKEFAETRAVQREFNDLQSMVAEEETESGSILSIFAHENWFLLLQASLLRIVFALGSSLPINLLSFVSFFGGMKTSVGVTLLLLIRLLAEIISIILIDRIGRRKILLISVGFSGLLLIICGIITVASDPNSSIVPITVIIAFYQFSLGIGLGNVSTTYLGEVFPLSKKAFSIFFVFAVECFIHIILILAMMGEEPNFKMPPFEFTVGVLFIAADVFFFKFYPETLGRTLKECINAKND